MGKVSQVLKKSQTWRGIQELSNQDVTAELQRAVNMDDLMNQEETEDGAGTHLDTEPTALCW